MAKKKAAPKKIDRAVERLYKSVDNYVRAKGGSLRATEVDDSPYPQPHGK